MGLLKPSLFGAISGKVGNLIFSHNRGGNYVKAFTVPTNPNTARQQDVRNIFSSLANAWTNALTATQRAAWNLYGSSVAMTNRIGEQIFLSGIAQFQRSNGPVVDAGLTRVDDGPTIFTLASTDPQFDPSISEATQLISVAFDDSMDWVGEDEAFMQVSMSIPNNPGVDFIKGPYQVAGTIEGDGTTPPTTPTTIAVPFAVAETQKVIVKARIGRADGRLSNEFQSTVTVAG